MPRRALLSVLFLCVVGSAEAQRLAPLPPAAVEPQGRLVRDFRVRYLLRQLDLSEKQATEAKALVDVHYSRVTRPSLSGDDVDRLRSLMQAFQEAKDKNDEAEMRRVQAEIRLIGQSLDPEPEFWRNLDPILTDEQRKKLSAAEERLKVNPTGAIRAEDIIERLESEKLTDEQKSKLAELRKLYEKAVAEASGEDAAAERLDALNKLMVHGADLLTPDQLRGFRGSIRMLRPDLADRRLTRSGDDTGRRARGSRGGDDDEDEDDGDAEDAGEAGDPAPATQPTTQSTGEKP